MTVGSDMDLLGSWPDVFQKPRPEIPLDLNQSKALSKAVRRRAKDLIDALHELDGSRTGTTVFNRPWLARARDLVEEAVAIAEDQAP